MNATNLNRLLHLLALVAAMSLLTQANAATLLTQVDDFSVGAFGWGPLGGVLAGGGPAGAGDAYFAYESRGGGGSGSRMVVVNEDSGNQWQGDYLAEGLTGFELDVLNDGQTDINLRIAIANGTTWFASSDPVIVSPGSGWNSVAFQIDAASMTGLGGSDSFDTVAANVQRIRILSSVGLPSVAIQGGARGDAIAASIGLDNIRAIGAPEPGSLAIGVAGIAAAAIRRRRA